jgi:hypothetical protein
VKKQTSSNIIKHIFKAKSKVGTTKTNMGQQNTMNFEEEEKKEFFL